MGRDRLKYIEKHKSDFKSEEDFYKHIEMLPEIIGNPDYVGIHPSGESIEYIKRIDEVMIVAVRLTGKKALWVRTAFPLSNDKLETYISSGSVKACNLKVHVDISGKE